MDHEHVGLDVDGILGALGQAAERVGQGLRGSRQGEQEHAGKRGRSGKAADQGKDREASPAAHGVPVRKMFAASGKAPVWSGTGVVAAGDAAGSVAAGFVCFSGFTMCTITLPRKVRV